MGLMKMGATISLIGKSQHMHTLSTKQFLATNYLSFHTDFMYMSAHISSSSQLRPKCKHTIPTVLHLFHLDTSCRQLHFGTTGPISFFNAMVYARGWQYSSWAKSCLPPIFVNLISRDHSHVHLFMDCL